MDPVGKGELEFGDMKHGKDPRVTQDRAASAEVEARERFRAMFPGHRLGAAVIRVDDASAVQDLQEVVVAVTNNERMAALYVRVPVSHGDQPGADAVEYLYKRAKGQEDEYRYLLSQSPLQLPYRRPSGSSVTKP
jgi:hypothetical protein